MKDLEATRKSLECMANVGKTLNDFSEILTKIIQINNESSRKKKVTR
jgi:hypothetical protein